MARGSIPLEIIERVTSGAATSQHGIYARNITSPVLKHYMKGAVAKTTVFHTSTTTQQFAVVILEENCHNAKSARELSDVLVCLLDVGGGALRHELLEVLAVVGDAALDAEAIRVQLPRQSLQQGRLAGPRGAQQQCHAPLRCGKRW